MDRTFALFNDSSVCCGLSYLEYLHLNEGAIPELWCDFFANIFVCILDVIISTLCPQKTVTCIRCHISGKQRRISTKFYANTETLNGKQVAKFQQNRSTSATATASLVRSLKSISVHYRHRRDWLSSVRPCEWQDFSTPKICVQNVHRVLEVERELEDVDTTPLADHFIDDHLVEMFPLFDQEWLQLVDVTWLQYTRSCSFPKSGSRLG